VTVTLRDVRLEQRRRDDWAVTASGPWASADTLWPHLQELTNIVDAARQVDWSALLPESATVLDLGCGSGWLTGLLSAEERVERVIAWDGSPHLLEEVLPRMVELAGGDRDKVEQVCGDFLPLVLDDGSVDAVVMSSAFHHADDPHALLAELVRVVVPGGPIVLLNETPWHPLAMLSFAGRHFLATATDLLGRRLVAATGALTEEGALYDPVLGDRAYTLRTWHTIADRARCSLEVRSTGLPSYPAAVRKKHPLEPVLHHFVLRSRVLR
jgi:SAM-dependent methyltransferase